MKKFNLLVLLLAWMGTFAQHMDWAKRGGLWAYDYGYGISNDASGNVYIAGKFEYNAQFSGVTLQNQGNHDIYVAKYNSSGGLTWIHSAGGYSGDYAHAVNVKGNSVFIAGEIQGSGNPIKFVGSSITIYPKGGNDAFVAKYDLNGNILWARSGGGYSDDKAQAVAGDPFGNVYIAGYFTGTTIWGSTSYGSYGSRDIFLAKYDPNGNLQWVKRCGSGGRDEAIGLKCDDAGNVYMCGMYNNNCSFLGQWLTAPNGYMNAYLAKINSGGGLIWVRTAGGNWDDVAWSVTLDNYGKVFISGEFNADANFSGQHLYTTGKADAFVAAYTTDGAIVWTRKAGGQLVDRARGIGSDGNNIYITGQFGWTASFGGITRTAADSSDIFMAALSNSGNWLWATSVGGGADAYENLGYESGIAITGMPSGEVYATGAMLNGGQFGSTYLSGYGRTDVYLTKIRNGVARESDQSPLASGDILLDGKAVDHSVLVSWNKEPEKDMALDRSSDGENFTELHYYLADEMKSGKVSYKDVTAGENKTVYYRVRIIDPDGVTAFSKTAAVNTKAELAPGAITMDVFPNPARTELAIDVKNEAAKTVKLSIVDMSGRQVWQQEVVNGCKVDVSPWTRGIYVVVIQDEHAILSRQKILVE